MSLEQHVKAMNLPAGTPVSVRIVAITLAHYAAADGSQCYPAIATIARHTGMDARTVQRILRTLVARGWLIPVTVSRGRHASRYQLKLPEPGAEPAATPAQHHGSTPAPDQGTLPSTPAVRQGTNGSTPAMSALNPGNTPPNLIHDPIDSILKPSDARASNPQAARAPETRAEPHMIPKAERDAFKAELRRKAGLPPARPSAPADSPDRRSAMQRALDEIAARKAGKA